MRNLDFREVYSFRMKSVYLYEELRKAKEAEGDQRQHYCKLIAFSVRGLSHEVNRYFPEEATFVAGLDGLATEIETTPVSRQLEACAAAVNLAYHETKRIFVEDAKIPDIPLPVFYPPVYL